MILINKLYDTRPIVVHAQGREEFCPLWHEIARKAAVARPVASTSDLSIITWNSGVVNDDIYKYTNKRLGCFEDSCRRLGLNVIALGANTPAWTNRMKIPLTVEFLSECKSEYVMGCDSSDVIILDNPDLAVQRLVGSGCEMLFNAEILHWPFRHNSIDFEQKTGEPPFTFINGGAWIGRRAFCLDFFQQCEAASAHISLFPYSEQICIKTVYPSSYPKVKGDYKCRIFQTLNRVGEDVLSINIPKLAL